MSKGVEDNSNPLAPLKAFRQVRHERLQKDLFEVQKTAKLRSGARGSEARKVLIAYEKKVAESIAAYVKYFIFSSAKAYQGFLDLKKWLVLLTT